MRGTVVGRVRAGVPPVLFVFNDLGVVVEQNGTDLGIFSDLFHGWRAAVGFGGRSAVGTSGMLFLGCRGESRDCGVGRG